MMDIAERGQTDEVAGLLERAEMWACGLIVGTIAGCLIIWAVHNAW